MTRFVVVIPLVLVGMLGIFAFIAAQSAQADRQGVCDHGTPCGCYAEGHAAGLAESYAKRRPDPPGDLARVRRVLDHVNESAEDPHGAELQEP